MKKFVEIQGIIKDNFVIEVDEDTSEADIQQAAFSVMQARMKNVGIPKFIWHGYEVTSIEDREDKFDID